MVGNAIEYSVVPIALKYSLLRLYSNHSISERESFMLAQARETVR